MALLQEFAGRLMEIWLRTGEHVYLTFVSTLFAIALGVPLGILAAKWRRSRGPVLGVVGILQTIPSLAMLALLLALFQQIGVLPAIVALILYALLAIVRNTIAGLDEVTGDVLDAATGLGMTKRQSLMYVELPLALPVIIAGIRTAAVVGVGIATLSAFIGAGGLGQFINRGLALSNTNLILLGAIPAAILALLVDGSIALTASAIRPMRQAERTALRLRLRPLAIVAPLILAAAGGSGLVYTKFASGPTSLKGGTVSIGSKNFTEQLILVELMAQLIETHTELSVDRRVNLGGTMICHGALLASEIDLYPEYTGTALTAILEREVVTDPGQAYDIVKNAYATSFDVVWLEPFGFNNTYAATVRREMGEEEGWDSISDMAAQAERLRAGLTSEFAERPDGYPGLKRAYDMEFSETFDLDASIMYKALADGEVDVIFAFATDGRIAAYDLQPIDDDKNFFPPYYAAPVVRREALTLYPEIEPALNLLGGKLSDETMQKLNYEVDENKRAPREVANEFLEQEGLFESDVLNETKSSSNSSS